MVTRPFPIDLLRRNDIYSSMSISNIVKQQITQGSWIRRMFEEGIRLKAKHGTDSVCDLTLGNPYLDPPPEFMKALRKVVKDEKPGVHVYMQNSGYPETRDRVAGRLRTDFDLPFTRDHVVMTVGAAGALNVILKSIVEPDDEVILVSPYFCEYGFYICNHQGKKVVSPATRDFLPDLEDLERRITSRTRAVIINSPNNPTGRLIPADTLESLGNLLRARSEDIGHIIYLVSDEPYRRLLFDGLEYVSPLKYYDDTLVAMSHSKDLSLAGERIGYLAISPKCRHAADLFDAAIFLNRTLGYINAPALMQRMLAEIEAIRPDVRVYQAKRDMLYGALKDMGYDVLKPEGTFYMFPRSPLPDDLDFIKVLQDRLVLVSPGSGFECPGFFRISFCVDDRVIERSLPRFEDAMKSV